MQNAELIIPVTGGAARVAVAGDSHLDEIRFTPDGKTVVYTGQSSSNPVEFFRAYSTSGFAVARTHLNDLVLGSHQLTKGEESRVRARKKRGCMAF